MNTLSEYHQFVASKRREIQPAGFEVSDLPDFLFPHQQAIVRWAVRMGRCAIFADTGLGKTAMQLVWADLVYQKTGQEVVLFAPLAVGDQTAAEAQRFGLRVPHIVNYERLHQIDPSQYGGVVLDESSILKSQSGKTRAALIEAFSRTPYRLACTATPAPNDHTELGNHAEFLGICSKAEMLAEYFVHDGGSTQDWRLKGHAAKDFWRWVSSWAVMLRRPSDLGFEDGRYDLPPLNIETVTIKHETEAQQGMLFGLAATTLTDQRQVKRDSIEERCQCAADLVASKPDEQWLIWCDLNDESSMITSMISGAVEVAGSTSDDDKRAAMLGFARGDVRVLVTKAKIAGFGMNWQSCANMIFVSPTHSYEQWYQAVRRCWRFGQNRPVTAYMIQTSADAPITRNLQRKRDKADAMASEMAAQVKTHQMATVLGRRPKIVETANQEMRIPTWL